MIDNVEWKNKKENYTFNAISFGRETFIPHVHALLVGKNEAIDCGYQ